MTAIKIHLAKNPEVGGKAITEIPSDTTTKTHVKNRVKYLDNVANNEELTQQPDILQLGNIVQCAKGKMRQNAKQNNNKTILGRRVGNDGLI